MFGEYAGYIVPAYGISALVIAAMAAWIAVVHRRHRAEIARLEEKGIKRRSEGKRNGASG